MEQNNESELKFNRYFEAMLLEMITEPVLTVGDLFKRVYCFPSHDQFTLVIRTNAAGRRFNVSIFGGCVLSNAPGLEEAIKFKPNQRKEIAGTTIFTAEIPDI